MIVPREDTKGQFEQNCENEESESTYLHLECTREFPTVEWPCPIRGFKELEGAASIQLQCIVGCYENAQVY